MRIIVVALDGNSDDIEYASFIKNNVSSMSDLLIVANPGDHFHDKVNVTHIIDVLREQLGEHHAWTCQDTRVVIDGMRKWPSFVPSRLFIEPSMRHGSN